MITLFLQQSVQRRIGKGRSDPIGAVPAERLVEPGEIVATICRSMGLDLETRLPGPQGRPFTLVDSGVHEIKELL